MTLKNLLQFISNEHQRLIDHYKSRAPSRRKLARTVKIMEEVGELSEQVMTSLNDQRKSKLKEDNQAEIEEEVADVIITTLLLAQEYDFDLGKALAKKIDKIKKRKY